MLHPPALSGAWPCRWLPALALLLGACSGSGPDPMPRLPSGPSASASVQVAGEPGGYAGSAVCGRCHAREFAAWRGSHHDLAMQAATADTVLGDFGDVEFDGAGTRTRFLRLGDRHVIHTAGPDGVPAAFDVAYTFGHQPLQQYLIALPGGRLQAFGIAWDSRPREQGGQRWFHLYPDVAPAPGHRLHWTGIDQTWNFMCAGCHSTGLERRYDAAAGRYDTRWAEMDVACEACHGPGPRHVRWAAEGARADVPDKGLGVRFHERRGVTWTVAPGTAFAVRSRARATRIEIDVCGRCHARALPLLDGGAAGGGLLDSHRPAFLDADQYWPDGQMRGEVFNWGPFLQSRMYRAGVTCSDCHEPHALGLRAEGNALCAQCHPADRFDRTAHTHHAQGGEGSRCTACHMPATTFMGVDRRHDHSFRIPRPDLAARLGTPDACTSCHTGRDSAWAAARLQAWFPDSRHRGEHFGEVLHAARRGVAGSGARLRGLASAAEQPVIVRATALRELAPWLDGESVALAAAALSDPDALLRLAAVELLAQLPPPQRAAHLAASLQDPVLAVRLEAAMALAGVPDTWITVERRAARTQAVAELRASLQANADRADALVALADLQVRTGDMAQAEDTLRQALSLDADSQVAALQLAELLRASGREQEGEGLLRQALSRQPDAAGLHHALGLSLVRQGRRSEALETLQRAAELAPEAPRLAWVAAVARHDLGDAPGAIADLSRALVRHPDHGDLLHLLATYELEAGRPAEARRHLDHLLALDPAHAGARDLLRWMRSAFPGTAGN